MAEPISLVKANPLLPAEDYVALRKKGFDYIEQLGSAIWTEYNNSDPGITILEAVCYAITDLGYRTGFEIKDLLTPDQLTDDTWKQIFYTARKILHNSPLTFNDYRKLLIDIKGVRNAWIEKSKNYEVPVWIDYNYLEPRKDYDCGCEDAGEKICYGRLGLDAINTEIYKQNFQTELARLKEELNKPNNTEEEKRFIQKQIDFLDWLIPQIPDDQGKLIPSKIVEFEGLYNVIIEYEEDTLQKEQREQVRQTVVDRLNRNRNLCEDFLSVNAVEYDDMGIRASLVLEEYADPDMVLAEIFFVIYKYFTPSIHFYTILQMIEKGYQVDEIFEGPPLKHGFIDDAELEKTDLFRDIRLSDIISEIVDIKGVKAITYLYMPINSIENSAGASPKSFFNEWVKFLKQQRKVARIIPEKSEVIFCKERELISYFAGRPGDRRPDRMLKLFKDLKTRESKYKLIGHSIDFDVPTGEFMDLEDYYPVTYSLPMCYGVSERAGLPPEADEKRRVQALQLKGYLLFFEQLLSGHLAQLNHLRDLFSFDEAVKHTAFIREFYSPGELNEIQLKEMEDLKTLLVDHNGHGQENWEKILEDFAASLQHFIETPEQFQHRRNRMLNHLLARFSEDLSEYEAISRWLTPSKVEERLLRDKINILKDGEYYKISSQRGKAFDYTQYPVWDTPNIAGAERRLSRLLGFRYPTRHTLSTSYIVIEAVVNTNDNNKKNVIKFIDPEDAETVLLTSVEVKEGCCTELLLNEILTYAEEWPYYKFINGAKQRRGKYDRSMGPFWFELYDSTDAENAVLLANGEQLETEAAREDAFEKLKKLLDLINKNEGLHLVEHLLLRPKLDEVLDEENEVIPVNFLDICLDNCDLAIGLLDDPKSPGYRKRIRRIPAAKCFDEMPWILEYFKVPVNAGDNSILFQEAFANGDEPILLKFRRYELLTDRIRDLQEYGSERINYEIVSNEEEQLDPINTKHSFIIHGEKETILAQSDFIFTRRTRKQIEEGVPGGPLDIDDEIERLMIYFSFEMDLYCEEDPCDHGEDAYSFRTTVVFPCWPKRLRNVTFRNLVEKTIQLEFPAHIHTRVVWLGLQEMKEFETVYERWLGELAQNEMPRYEITNQLIKKLNTLKPCDTCDDDCHD
jgi:hypothetical protein